MLSTLIFLGILISIGNSEDSLKNSTFPSSTEVFNITEVITEIDYNISTVFNTTEIPSTTTNASLTIKSIKHVNFERDHDELCLCDLHLNACDIGCCCDKECTYEKRKIFERCEGVSNVFVDRGACQYYENYYVNYTAHEWEIQNNDFLCVAKTNLPPTYAVQREKPFRSYTETILEVKTGNFWPPVNLETLSETNFSEPYVQGIPLKYIVDNATMDIFKLSEAFFTSVCEFQSNVSYLHDFDRECVHVLSESNNYLNVDFYKDILFIAIPDKINASLFTKNLLACPEPLCLKPIKKICDHILLRNCRNISGNETLSLRCRLVDNRSFCENVLDSFKIIFFHEGIAGIKNITLLFHLVNVSFSSGDQYGINQKISVAHEWASVKLNFSDILSGNPGYLIGKPILTGTLVNGTISRSSNNYSDNFLTIPYEDMGICEVGEHLYQAVEFGYSTILLCKIKGSFLVENNTKPGNICKQMQRDVMKYWSIDHVNGYAVNRTFGLFGNANSSTVEEWGNILFEKTPENVLKNVLGVFSNKNRTLICYGLVFGLNIDIYHSKVDLKNLVDQEKILGITNQFHLSNNRSLIFDVINRKFNFDFDLDTRVSFRDVTSEKSRKIFDPPSLNIELPSDFFYPFVKMGNSGKLLIPQIVLILFSMICKLFF